MIVLVISHVHFLRDALIGILGGDGDISAIGACFGDAVEAALAGAVPDLIVVEASHPKAAALVAAARARHPKIGVVVVANRDHDEEFLAWADIGISGYLGPDTSASALVSTVRRAAAGDVVCPPRLTPLLLNGVADRSSLRASRAGVHTLTAREHEIAALLADGMSNKLIARRLNVALPTVKNHVHRILDKWDVRSRGEAAARYRRQVHERAPHSAHAAPARASHVAQMGGATLRDGEVRFGRPSP
jgi:DNA-binding NarL/FixJ family response regulator